jgi:hypothetical protein
MGKCVWFFLCEEWKEIILKSNMSKNAKKEIPVLYHQDPFGQLPIASV